MTPEEAERLKALEVKVASIEKGMAENTRITKEVSEGTSELLEIFKTLKVGIRFFYIAGNVIKWAATLAATCAGAYLAFREFLGIGK